VTESSLPELPAVPASWHAVCAAGKYRYGTKKVVKSIKINTPGHFNATGCVYSGILIDLYDYYTLIHGIFKYLYSFRYKKIL